MSDSVGLVFDQQPGVLSTVHSSRSWKGWIALGGMFLLVLGLCVCIIVTETKLHGTTKQDKKTNETQNL
jgi:hypothetical protein